MVRLRDVGVEGVAQEAEELDLLDFTRCIEYRYTSDRSSMEASVLIRLVTETDAELALLLEGVRSVRVPEASPNLWFSELEIVDVRDRGMEGIRFLVQSEHGGGFVAYCQNIQFVSYEAIRA